MQEVTAEQLHAELRRLCKGFGVQEPYVGRRVGPALRQVCGIDNNTSHVEVRRKLVEKLSPLSKTLPAGRLPLSQAVRVALAIEEVSETQSLRLGERQQHLADIWAVEIRTVRRNTDLAFQLFSAHLAKQANAGVSNSKIDEWRLEELNTFLRLDGQTPEAREERTIVSNVDNLRQIGNAFGLPRPANEAKSWLDLDVELEYGGRLVNVQQPTADYFVHYIELPRPLQIEERHRFSRIVRIPKGQKMTPRYVFRPLHPCELFELRVRFGLDSPPKLAWVISGLSDAIYRSNRYGKDMEVAEMDVFGEVQLTFRNLRVGLGYGLCWQPA